MAVYDEERKIDAADSDADDKFKDIVRGETDSDFSDIADSETDSDFNEIIKNSYSSDEIKALEDSANETQSSPQEELEYGGLDDQNGPGFFKADGKASGRNSKSKKRIAAIGGTIVVTAAISVLSFFALLPSKLNHVVENAQEHFFATTTSATQRWSESLTTNYVKKHLLPSLSANCPSSKASRSCISSDLAGSSPAMRLYRAWRDSNLEGKLYDNYGIEFKREGTSFTMNITGKDGKTSIANLDDFARSSTMQLGDVRVTGGRSEVRAAWRSAINGQTRFESALNRHRVGALLKRKYGLERCIIACNTRDDFADWKDNKRMAFKLKFVERVVTPRNEIAGLVLTCLVSGRCGERSVGDVGEDGDRKDAFQKQVDSKLSAFARKYGSESLENILKLTGELEGKSITQALIKAAVTKIAGDTAGQAAADAIPIIGWINLAASIVGKVGAANDGLKKWIYVSNATAMVSFYMMYRSYVDEVKTGTADPEMLGSFVDSLGSEKGPGAEAAPMFEELFTSKSTVSAVGSLFTPSAKAQGEFSQYLCNNGQPVEGLVCPEDNLNTSTTVTRFLSFITDNGMFSTLETVADVWNSTAGEVINLISRGLTFLLDYVPGWNWAVDTMSGLVDPLIKAAGEYLLPSPFPDDIDQVSGAKNLTILVGGADVAGNDFAHYGLGGKQLTPTQVAVIRNEVQKEDAERFASLPLRDRLFNLDESRSLVSQVAMATPFDNTTPLKTASNMARMPIKLFSSISMFGGLFSSRVSAADGEDPYNVLQFGYPLDDPVFNTDPESLTDEFCEAQEKAWNENVTIDESTGMDVHTTVDICKLNRATSTGLGATSNNLESGSLPATVEGDDIISGVPGQYIAADLVVSDDTTDIPCKAGDDYGPQDGYDDGKLVKIRTCRVNSTVVNSQISGNVESMFSAAEAEGIKLSGGGFRTLDDQIDTYLNWCAADGIAPTPGPYPKPLSQMRRCEGAAAPGYSNHQMGYAIDVSCEGILIYRYTKPGQNRCFDWLVANAGKYGFKEYGDGKKRDDSAYEAWHWSVDGN